VALIRLEDVHFAYAGRPVLAGFDLAVPEDAVTVLVGPSGSGKSTVLRLIAGFEMPDRGRVWIGSDLASGDGRTLLPPEARGAGMVFQDLALWPHMTVRQTLEFVLGRDAPPEERRRRIEDTLRLVGLDRHAGARPASLSGGERQRVALARAIVTRPRILLMDEPLSSLDPPLRQALLGEIRQLRERLGLTILYVTHNRRETFALGDHAAVIRGGRIEQWGSPRDLYERPRSAFVASFLGRCALLPAWIAGDRINSPLGAIPRGTGASSATADGEVYLVIRPEDVPADPAGPWSGRVERAVDRGDGFETLITGTGWQLWTSLAEEPQPGSLLRFSIRKFSTVPRDEP